MVLILCHGGMFSGKSNLAMGRVGAYSRSDLNMVLYQPRANTRDVFQDKPVWFSRAGGKEMNLLPAKWYESPEQVLKDFDKMDVFGFEEWHLYSPEVFDVMKELHEKGKFVVAAGLDYYFNGEPVEIFDKLRNLKNTVLLQGVGALCQDCMEYGLKNMAVRTQRRNNSLAEPFDAPKIVVEGSKDYQYQPVCFDHWEVLPPTNPELMEDYKKDYLFLKNH